MDQTKNQSIKKETETSYDDFQYKPSDLERVVVDGVFSKFSRSAEERNRNFENFDGLNLIDYIEDSYRRATTNIDARDDIEDWQAAIHDPFTRNKINAILGKVVSVLPSVEVRHRGDEDIRKSQILTNLYDYQQEMDDAEEFTVVLLNEAIMKGTAIGYVGHEFKEQKKRSVESTGDDIKVKTELVRTNRVYSKLIRLEDFYPSNVGVRHIHQMPYCFVRDVLPLSQFLQDYQMYSRSEYVRGKSSVYNDREDRPYYLDYISDDIKDGEVEVLFYYNKDVDEYVITANGVWLNPIFTNVDEEVGEEVCPLPFNHKELPFFDIKFEIFDGDFFYGKSLPDKLKNMQDVLNVLTNMLLDQSFLTIFAPILTNGIDSVEDDYLRPGRRIPIDTQGLPLNQSVMKLDMGTPSGWHQYILDYTRKIMEEASVDRVSQGIAGQGDRTTAQEIRVAAEGVSSMLGLFGRWVRSGLKKQASLITKNIMQFYTDPRYPVIEQVLGDGSSAEAKEVFSTFKINNTVLSNGKRGLKIIDMYRNPKNRPDANKLKAKADVYKMANKKEIEYVALDPAYIRNLDIDIALVPSTKSEMTKDLDKALALEKTRVYLSFFPDMANREELFANLAEKFGDDPTKIISENVLYPKQDNNMVDKGVGTEPQNNLGNNAARSMAGGNTGANSLVSLQNEMLG